MTRYVQLVPVNSTKCSTGPYTWQDMWKGSLPMAGPVQKVPVDGRTCSKVPEHGHDQQCTVPCIWPDIINRSLNMACRTCSTGHERSRTIPKGPCWAWQNVFNRFMNMAEPVQNIPAHKKEMFNRSLYMAGLQLLLKLAPSQMFNHDLCFGNLFFISPVSYLRRGEAKRGAMLANPVL